MGIRLAVFDLDGTLLSGTKTVMPALADALWKARLKRGLGARLLATAGMIGLVRKLRLISRERYTLVGSRLIARWMAAVAPTELEQVMADTARHLLMNTRHHVAAEMQQRKGEGYRPVIVSAVLQPLLEILARRFGCAAVGTQMELDEAGQYTGRLAGPYCSGPGKAEALQAWADSLEHPVDWSESVAYADTLADLAMLDLVGTPVAVAPEPGLRQIAEQRRWRIIEVEADVRTALSQ